MTRERPPADRGLAVGVLSFIAIIVVAALLFTLMDPALVEIFDMSSSQADSQTAQDVIDLRQQIWGAILFFALFLGIVSLIAQSVYESRTGF